MITAKTKICAIIGNPVYGSLSPIIHNAGFKAKDIGSDFVGIALNVAPDKLENFIGFLRSSNIRGLSVTLPHKEKVIPMLDNIDDTAKKIGAVNTIINNDGKLTGYNTDWLGVKNSLLEKTVIKGKKAAVIGAGGAAKAFVYALLSEGADVTIFNRTPEKAKELADVFKCNYKPLSDTSSISDSDIVCNASTVGFSGTNQQQDSPIPAELIKQNMVVFDAIYSPRNTKLITDAKLAGAEVITGIDMLLNQGYEQFKLFTGLDAPKEAMTSAVIRYLNEK